MNIKKRVFPESNYKSIYFNGQTMRIALDPSKPITELEYPEFYDVAITQKCNAKCAWCYQDSTPDGELNNDIIQKFNKYFGDMTENQLPFQIAYGGGEPTIHPQFTELLKVTYDRGICPNYTTNGMHISDELLGATVQYCGGVAISCHPHLKEYWEKAFNKFHNAGVRTNFHNIIGSKKQIDDFIDIYEEYKGKTEYFVLLPLIGQGRAGDLGEGILMDEEYFYDKIKYLKDKYEDISDIAFGANMYKFLLKHGKELDLELSLYEPEIMSKYLTFTSGGKLHPSSFNTDVILKENIFKDIEDGKKE